MGTGPSEGPADGMHMTLTGQRTKRRVVVEATVPMEKVDAFVRAARRAGHVVEATDETAETMDGKTGRVVRVQLDPEGLDDAGDGDDGAAA